MAISDHFLCVFFSLNFVYRRVLAEVAAHTLRAGAGGAGRSVSRSSSFRLAGN